MTLSVRFTVRMTEEEKQILEKKANQLNVKASAVARCAIFKYDLPTTEGRVADIDWGLYHQLGEFKYELNAICTDISQLARDENLQPAQLQLDALNKILRRIEQSIGSISKLRTLTTESAGLKPSLGVEDDR
ncbi:hypothetical protein HCU40_18645 (plasmid) [Pseudanabaena biceps]|nr:hypothetical protein [Pseudanabaena biceps]